MYCKFDHLEHIIDIYTNIQYLIIIYLSVNGNSNLIKQKVLFILKYLKYLRDIKCKHSFMQDKVFGNTF